MLKRSIILNLAIMLLIVAGLLFLFFNSLNTLTNHGKETKVPSLEHKNLSDAMKLLNAAGFQVNIDSTYLPYKDPLEVLFQEPEAGMTVKYGRTIFLTVNRKLPPTFPMPNLNHMSFRNALLTLQSYRLVMGDTIYRPDLEAGAVLEQQFNGKIITPGTPIPYGAKIDLVVGDGLTEEIDVPNLIGKSWLEAKALLATKLIMPNAVFDGEISDSNTAIVYQQFPEYINELDILNRIKMGDMMDLRIKQNPSATELFQNQGGSRKYATPEDSALMNDNVNVIETPTSNDAVDTTITNAKRRMSTRGVEEIPTQKPEAVRKRLENKRLVPAANKTNTNNTSTTLNNATQVVKPKPKPKPIAPKKPQQPKEPVINKKSSTETEYN